MHSEPRTKHPATRSVIIAAIVATAAASTLAACSGGTSGAVRSGPTAPATTATTDAPRWDGEISALTYNVAGLPATLSGSDPETNIRLIGPKLNAFDLVLLQETWKTPERNPFAPMRVYHEILEAESTHRYKSPMPAQPFGSDPARSTALLADGLAFFSNFPMGDVTRTPWTDCFGGPDTSDHGAADCLAVKGFASTTVTVADGARIDVYNLHGEAGSNSKDQELQAADYVQLADYITTHSKGSAIILGGDTDLHVEADPVDPLDTADAKIWSTFLADAGLTDSCPPSSCDDPARTDRFAYRSGAGVDLGVLSRTAETQQFTDPAGGQLSGRAPLAVTFGWRHVG